MFFITQRGLLISAQLMGQGHFAEAYSIISNSSEAVGHAVVMSTDIGKTKIWIKSSGKKGFKKTFGRPFPPGNSLLHPKIFSIYNITRDYGSHANFGSTIHFTKKTDKDTYTFSYCDFADINWIKRNILMVIHSYYEFIYVFKELFESNLSKEWDNSFKKLQTEWLKHKEENRDLFNVVVNKTLISDS